MKNSLRSMRKNSKVNSMQNIKVQGSRFFIIVTYTIIQGIISSEMLVRTGPLNGKCKKIKNNNKIKIT